MQETTPACCNALRRSGMGLPVGFHEKHKIPSTKSVRLGLSWEGGAGWTGNESKDGILALTFLMKIIKMGKIFNFSYYCCGMGILMIIL